MTTTEGIKLFMRGALDAFRVVREMRRRDAFSVSIKHARTVDARSGVYCGRENRDAALARLRAR